VTPGARRKALAVLAGCATVAGAVVMFWLAAEVVAHAVEVPRG
jgi:hypothetical protein